MIWNYSVVNVTRSCTNVHALEIGSYIPNPG